MHGGTESVAPSFPSSPGVPSNQGALYEAAGGEEERKAALAVAEQGRDDEDVAVFEHCVASVHDPDLCNRISHSYAEHDYADLMNTTFALIPSGHSPATYRLTEALSAGCIPVFIHTGFVKPFPEKIDWPRFSFSFSPEDASRILGTLRAVPAEDLARMQVKPLLHVALFLYLSVAC